MLRSLGKLQVCSEQVYLDFVFAGCLGSLPAKLVSSETKNSDVRNSAEKRLKHMSFDRPRQEGEGRSKR